ncbi:TAXI family TRAP transporter solute-binding subunit [Terrabacter sp. GCM10028922]|uniref:TAXI family TRAP transporter solute-binding subunit n=1 Tax=Terrabacter sp. GCM10028922 TaxID=3273428 RepID=UPI00361B9753
MSWRHVPDPVRAASPGALRPTGDRRPGRRTVLRAALATAAGLAGVAGVAGGGCTADDTLDRLDIACGEPGGTYIQFGRLLGGAAVAEGLARTSTALVTAGSVDNLARLRTGSAGLAMCLADSARESAWTPAAIGRVYQNYLQVVVPAGSPVTSVEQLRGRPVSIGAPGSGTAATTRRVFGALGLLDAGSRRVEVSELVLAEAIRRLRAGTLAALVFSSGIPIPALTAVAAQFPVRLLDLTEVFDRLTQVQREVYARTTVPAATYDMPADVTTVGVANLLLSRPDLPEDTAARLVDLVLGRARDLVPPPSTGIQYLTQQTLVDTFPISLHAGAARRYRELHG